MDQSFMKERKILPLVLSMSLPMVISMAVNALYNIVDSYFVAKLSEEAMTALALVYRCWYWNRDQCRDRLLSGSKKTDHSKSDSNAGHCLKCFAWNIADSPVYSRSVEVSERIFR